MTVQHRQAWELKTPWGPSDRGFSSRSPIRFHQRTSKKYPLLLLAEEGRKGTFWNIPECSVLLNKPAHRGNCLTKALPAGHYQHLWLTSVQFSSVAQLCRTLCDPMDSITPGFPVHYQILKLAQTHVHWVGDAIQPSHPLFPSSPPAFNLSQNPGLFQWVSSSY